MTFKILRKKSFFSRRLVKNKDGAYKKVLIVRMRYKTKKTKLLAQVNKGEEEHHKKTES